MKMISVPLFGCIDYWLYQQLWMERSSVSHREVCHMQLCSTDSLRTCDYQSLCTFPRHTKEESAVTKAPCFGPCLTQRQKNMLPIGRNVMTNEEHIGNPALKFVWLETTTFSWLYRTLVCSRLALCAHPTKKFDSELREAFSQNRAPSFQQSSSPSAESNGRRVTGNFLGHGNFQGSVNVKVSADYEGDIGLFAIVARWLHCTALCCTELS
ncbi:hypothetical protein JZ751_004630 [Albula glossodonta]|uniref:Uncharacterized protein n=1 Tax=Albula glossodonta TaxID=121402 RepID=A0A8T2MT98_9TELE|nr:hypothetical protein JZ751_025344 [Albula glossodonta]KAG9335500.1 hypothetical protein JZ751_004630 [Albula glossodonta]